jgi:fructan beta-fructosidase
MNIDCTICRTLRCFAMAWGLTSALSAKAEEPIRADVLVADFEGETYGDWKVEGEAFGKGPARGTLPGQMHVEGFEGEGLVNSFSGGDGATGKLTSPAIKIDRRYVHFLIGGGGWSDQTCMNLVVDGKVVRTAVGPNVSAGGSERLELAGWEVAEYAGKDGVIQIIDQHQGGWGHINLDHIVLSDKPAPLMPVTVTLEKTLTVTGSHLIVPVSNRGKAMLLGIYDGDRLVQNFNVELPHDGDISWLAAYPLESFGLKGKPIKIAVADGKRAPQSFVKAFDQIKVGSESDARSADDYSHPYRNQFHASTRRGWNNDPNGMVFHDGKYHLYYQYNPFGIQWGNMHWGHFESTDLVHWKERPIALFQKTVQDMAFSGGGFVDFNNSAGLGKNTMFVAFTSTGRGECLAYTKDGGLTFTELEENPVVKHAGRDPKIIWYEPDQKWVMVIYDETDCEETKAVPPADNNNLSNRNFAFYESKDLRRWARTGAFTDPDREAVFECPEMFELPIEGRSGETRWIVLGAQNRYFVGNFDGKTFHKESGPHGTSHGAFYAAQTFSDVPDGRRIQIGWVRTDTNLGKFPDQIVNMALTLPHETTLRETESGLRVFFWPTKEVENLRGEVLAEGQNLTSAEANELLQKCAGQTSEVLIEFSDVGAHSITINAMDAGFSGRSARIFTDRTFNEVYADDGFSYELRCPNQNEFPSTRTQLMAKEGTTVRSLKIYRLKSIWSGN